MQTKGSKLWRFRYRFGGRANMLTFGAFPAVSLIDARARREEARKLITNGIDPSVQRKLDRMTAETIAGTTFGLVAADY